MGQDSSGRILLLDRPTNPLHQGNLWKGRILDNCQGMAIAKKESMGTVSDKQIQTVDHFISFYHLVSFEGANPPLYWNR
jgi:hypothetical protein